MGSHLEGGHCGLLCKCRIFPTDAPVQLEQKYKDGLKILVTNILLTNMFNVLLGGVKRVAHGKNEGEDEDGDGIKSDWACPH